MTGKRITSVVLFEGWPLVLIEHGEFLLPNDILDWYATNYDIDRRRIRLALGMDTVLAP